MNEIIDTICEPTGKFVAYPTLNSPGKVFHAHSGGQIDPFRNHICSDHCCKGYPVQSCENMCGVITVVMSAVSALCPTIWKEIGLTGKIWEKVGVKLLKNLTEKSDNFSTLATSNIRLLLFLVKKINKRNWFN